jgi:LPXTG-site transpeptidase (sortase) family protein
LKRCQQRTLSFNTVPSVEKHVSAFSTSDVPASIDIPKRGINLDIKPAKINNGQWEISPDSASFLSQSSVPGKGGNIVIYAHNKRDLFGNLIAAEYGDIIHIRTNKGTIQEYQIRKKFIVSPDKIEVVEPTSYEVLTLFTCVGFADSQRLIIQAYPLS